MDMFGYIDQNEAKTIVDNCEWVLKKDLKIRNSNDDGASFLIMATYSGKQFFGSTDYIDHRNDTLEQLKTKVYKNMVDSEINHQRLHYYQNKDINKPYKKIVIEGYLGGYTGYFI